MSRWTSDPDALALLERSGGPFQTETFRRCWTDSHTGDVDVTWGGRLRGGTRAAVALIRHGTIAESFPFNYGGIVATQSLDRADAVSFLDAARRAAGCRWVVVRSVPLGPAMSLCHHGSTVAGWTDVVRIAKGADVEATFAHKARRALAEARAAGASAVRSRKPQRFVRLYGESARTHLHRYPDALLCSLAERGLAFFHEVEAEGECVASVMVLRGPTHWIAWLAAQSGRGRALNANYLAVADLLHAASEAGAPSVNMGISTGMSGVALFKRRFGAVSVAVTQDKVGSSAGVALDWCRRRARSLNRWIRARASER